MIIDLELLLESRNIRLQHLNLVLHTYDDVTFALEHSRRQYDILVASGHRALNVVLQPPGAEPAIEWLGQRADTAGRWRTLRPKNGSLSTGWRCRVRCVNDGYPH